MWQEDITQLPGLDALVIRVLDTTYSQGMELLAGTSAFRDYFSSLITNCRFAELRWEMPPVTRATALRPLEMALINSPGLVRRPDRGAFAEYFPKSATGADVVSFENMSGDATLFVPCPAADDDDYNRYVHLAAFLREASPQHVHALWRAVGEAVLANLDDSPLWLSTAGMGVAWLHIRLDQRPKYYTYGEYRRV